MKPKTKTKAEWMTANALCVRLKADSRTISRIVEHLDFRLIGKRKLRHYRLQDVRALVESDRSTRTQNKALRDQKISQEVRKLTLANDEKEKKLISRELVDRTIARSFGEMQRLLSQKLENEYPGLCVGLDIAGLRAKGRQVYDAIILEWRALVETTWPE